MCDGVGFALLRAVDSPLSDGDYRTFVFLCAQAGSSDSEGIFTDKTYDDLASRHPGTSPLTPAALRARIMRLVKAGLVQRERVGRTCWRTRIVTAQAPPDSIEGRRAASVGVASDSTLPLAHAVGETPDHPHLLTEGVGVMGCDTQPTAEESLGAVCYDIHADAGSSTSETLNLAGGPSIVITCNVDAEQGPVAKTTEGAGSAHRRPEDGTTGSGRYDWSVGAAPRGTQPPDLITDLMDLDRARSQQSDQGHGASANLQPATDPKLTALRSALHAELKRLAPEAMSDAGIAECLHFPDLTAAWLTYVTNPANGVCRPAAYLRKQVRSGIFPPVGPSERNRHAFPTSHHTGFGAGPARPARAPVAAPVPPAAMALAAGRATRWPLDVG